MKVSRIIILIILGVAIFGSVGYFWYDLFIKPQKAKKMQCSEKPLAKSPPDPGLSEFLRLKNLNHSTSTENAHNGWNTWIANHPNSPLLSEAKKYVGNINLMLLLHPPEDPTIVYTVKQGDSLAKIASRHHSNAELIQKANQLPGIKLQIAQTLIIPNIKPSLEINRIAKTLTLLDHNNFIKEYTLIAAPPPPANATKIHSIISDKIALAGSKRVTLGDKSFIGSKRIICINLSPPITSAPRSLNTINTARSTNSTLPVGISSNPAQEIFKKSETETTQHFPSGYVLAEEDLLEIFPIISRNTPVIIQ